MLGPALHKAFACLFLSVERPAVDEEKYILKIYYSYYSILLYTRISSSILKF